MSSLRDFILDCLDVFGFSPDDVSAIIVPIDDPRVPGGELRLPPGVFAAEARKVGAADARRDIMIELSVPSGGYDQDTGLPVGESRTFVAAYVGQSWIIARGPGASPYPFSSSDLVARGG